MSDEASETLVRQRIRNRLIEYFERAGSLETVAQFGAFETINAWEDWVPKAGLTWFQEPVFSREEQNAIASFYRAWLTAAEATEEDVFDAACLKQQDAWAKFGESASAALAVFLKRGRFSEEDEAFP